MDIRSGAAHVESSHRQAAPHLPHSLAACVDSSLLPCSVLHHPTLTRRLAARARILNKQPTRDFNAQLLAPVQPPPPQAPQTEHQNMQHIYMLLIRMIISTDAQIINAPPLPVPLDCSWHCIRLGRTAVRHRSGRAKGGGAVELRVEER